MHACMHAVPGLSCSTPDPSCSMHAGSSSPTRDPAWTPCIGSAESYPLDHQGSPLKGLFLFAINYFVKLKL